MAERKTTTRKKSVHKAPTKHSSAKRGKAAARQPKKLFHLEKDQQKFFTISITMQTLYWIIFSFAVLALGLWLVVLNLRVQDLYDQVDRSMVAQQELNDKLQDAIKASEPTTD